MVLVEVGKVAAEGAVVAVENFVCLGESGVGGAEGLVVPAENGVVAVESGVTVGKIGEARIERAEVRPKPRYFGRELLVVPAEGAVVDLTVAKAGFEPRQAGGQRTADPDLTDSAVHRFFEVGGRRLTVARVPMPAAPMLRWAMFRVGIRVSWVSSGSCGRRVAMKWRMVRSATFWPTISPARPRWPAT